jgi:hypothetical protein
MFWMVIQISYLISEQKNLIAAHYLTPNFGLIGKLVTNLYVSWSSSHTFNSEK